MSAAAEKRRSKCTPSTSASVVRTDSAPRSAAATAASSPMPTRTEDGAAGRGRRIRSISARSPMAATAGCGSLTGVVNGPGLANDGHFDLARVLELVLDPAGDVLRQPDGLLVRDVIALDEDPDLA